MPRTLCKSCGNLLRARGVSNLCHRGRMEWERKEKKGAGVVHMNRYRLGMAQVRLYHYYVCAGIG